MPAITFTIRDDFSPATYTQWRALAEADLNGASLEQKLITHTYEGIDILPLYTRDHQLHSVDVLGYPGQPPFTRGSSPDGSTLVGWDLRQEHSHPDLQISNHAILEDLEGGVTSLLLRFDKASRIGLDPDDPAAAALVAHDGLTAYSVDDLDSALSGVHMQLIGVALDAGASFSPAAALLIALWHRRNVSTGDARGAFNADPLAVLARDGELPYSTSEALRLLGDLACWTAKNCPHVTAVGIDTGPYHHAGATAAQDIGFGVSTGVEYLRAMADSGLDIDIAAQQILFNISLGTHHFLAIAKMRAARLVWSRIVEVCGGSPSAGAMQINARTSKRMFTQRDPYVNLLRNTVGVFAAGLGGANSITSIPFDALLGQADSFSRRVARNTALILQEEGHLHRVLDPSGGSWFIDRLTHQIAEKAWEIVQQIDGQGGMLQALSSGWVAQQIEQAFAPRAKNIARRKEAITGVSEFPDVAEEHLAHKTLNTDQLRADAIQRVTARRKDKPLGGAPAENHGVDAAINAASAGATIGQLAAALGFHDNVAGIQPLPPRYFASAFEELRAASDAWQATHGRRPAVFLANLGPVSHHSARASYSKNFFEAGGFRVLTNSGFPDADAAAKAFAQDSASIAVICSSDKLYPDLVPQAAAKLKAAGARTVVLAGNPGANEEAWRAAGVDRFIFIRCDALTILREILRDQGVFPELEAIKR